MRLGEIKAQALMLMGIGGSVNITYLDIDAYKNDPSYAPYIHAMNGSINRCFTRLYTVGAVDEEIKPLSVDNMNVEEYMEVDIPESLAQLVPLYVVGDVFAMEEPNVAQNKRNEFEESLEEYLNKRTFPQNGEVEIIYGV